MSVDACADPDARLRELFTEHRDALPTVIVNNGSDGPISAAWTLLGAPAVARGYGALLFDGPGQQSMLFEHRIAAAVADPGVLDVAESWWRNLGPELRELWESGDRETFDRVMNEVLAEAPALAAMWRWRAKPYGIDSPFELLTEVARYDVTPVVRQITTPLLITDPEWEHFWPGAARRLYDALPGPKELVPFSAAEGAHLHCEPLGRARFEQRVFDWLDERLNLGTVA